VSKTIPAAMQTSLDSGSTNFTTCVKITCTDSPQTVYAFTEWQEDLVVDAVTYLSAGGYNPSDMTSNSDNSVDNMDILSYFDAVGIEYADIRAGLLDNAEVRVFTVDPDDTSVEIKQGKGNIGVISTGDVSANIEIRRLLQKLQQTIGNVISEACRANLFDSQCQVQQNPSDWTAATAVTATTSGDAGTGSWVSPTTANGYIYKCTTAGTTGGTEPTWSTTLGGTTNDNGVVWVTVYANQLNSFTYSVTSRSQFTTAVPASPVGLVPDGWFSNGYVEITSGTNAGIKREIKTFTQNSPTDGEVVTYLPFPYDIATFVGVTLVAGCRKDYSADCISRFDNIYNFDGEPYVPGIDAVNATPEAP